MNEHYMYSNGDGGRVFVRLRTQQLNCRYRSLREA